MHKRTQKLKPDTVLKNYWRNNEQFADFFNAVLFDGKQIIKPEELEDADTLVEARNNDLNLHNINNIDLFNLLGILLNREISSSETKSKAIAYAKEHHVDKEVIMTVAGAAHSKIDYNALDRKGDADMCTVFEETWAEGKAEGKAEGIIIAGHELGLSEHDILEILQNKLNISLQKAQEYFNMFRKQII